MSGRQLTSSWRHQTMLMERSVYLDDVMSMLIDKLSLLLQTEFKQRNLPFWIARPRNRFVIVRTALGDISSCPIASPSL